MVISPLFPENNVLGLIFLGFGIALLLLSNEIIDYRVQYDEVCMDGTALRSPCFVDIVVTEKMEAPVFVYYELDNFYQNHRRYLKSRNSDQLNGKVQPVDKLDDCEPIIRNRDVDPNLLNLNGVPLDPDGPANPCGLVAKSVFTGKKV